MVSAMYLFQVLNSVQPLWGLLWAVAQISQVEVGLLNWAELGVQQVQKLGPRSPISRKAF